MDKIFPVLGISILLAALTLIVYILVDLFGISSYKVKQEIEFRDVNSVRTSTWIQSGRRGSDIPYYHTTDFISPSKLDSLKSAEKAIGDSILAVYNNSKD